MLSGELVSLAELVLLAETSINVSRLLDTALTVELDVCFLNQIARKIVLARRVCLIDTALLVTDQAARLAVGALNSIAAASSLNWFGGAHHTPRAT